MKVREPVRTCVENLSSSVFELRTVQSLASCYTDYANRLTAKRFTQYISFVSNVCNEIHYLSRAQNVPEALRMSKYPWITIWELVTQVWASGRQGLCRYKIDEGLLNLSCGAGSSAECDLRAGEMKFCALNVKWMSMIITLALYLCVFLVQYKIRWHK